MISAIGETSDFRQERWNCATDFERDKYEREMKQWKKDYPFAWEMMLGTMTFDEKVAYAEEMYPSKKKR